MKEPTKEQVREFWERIADEVVVFAEGKHYHFRFGDTWYNGEQIAFASGIPTIDLNNLFQLAVPTTKNKTYLAMWIICLIQDWAMGKDTNPALALFWIMRNDFNKEVKE